MTPEEKGMGAVILVGCLVSAVWYAMRGLGMSIAASAVILAVLIICGFKMLVRQWDREFRAEEQRMRDEAAKSTAVPAKPTDKKND